MSRTIQSIIEPQYVIEGAGVLLRRSFGPQRANLYDPFLLFDHFAFNDPVEGPIVGFPMHPHRGIETVTYMLEGSVHHRDSLGNAGLIGPGDVQWMTSGRGIMHEELPRRSPTGDIAGFQLWVNLPAALRAGATIRVVAGEVDQIHGPVTDIAAAPIYLDVSLQANAEFIYAVPAEHTAQPAASPAVGSGGGPGRNRALHPPVFLKAMAAVPGRKPHLRPDLRRNRFHHIGCRGDTRLLPEPGKDFTA